MKRSRKASTMVSRARGAANRFQDQIGDDPGFEAWLKNNYRPLAGGWQY